MTTVADLYASVLGRDVSQIDPEGLAYWTNMFGSTVDPTEAATFLSVAKVTEPTAVSSSNLFNQVDPSSTVSAAMQTATPTSAGSTMPTTVEDVYKTFYGNVDPQGAAYWKQQFGGNAINPQQASIMINVIGKFNPNINTGLTVEDAYKNYLGGNTDQAGINFWKQQFGNGPLTVSQLSQLTNTQSGINTDTGGGGLLGTGIGPDVSFSDAAKLAALYYGGSALFGGLGATDVAAEEALSGLDLGGVGASPNTWLGAGEYGIVPAAVAGTGAIAGGLEGATSTAAIPTTTGAATTGVLSGLTPTQIATIAKTGLATAGLLGGTKALGNLVSGATSTGSNLSLTPQNRAGISSGSAQYSPEYYQAIQSKYNQMMPQQPRDVTTELKNWYETKYAPTATITPKVV